MPKNISDTLVPISRFNKGEASKIFDEIKDTGYKIVVKNNTPACVMLTPERYQEMIEMIEDLYLIELVEERLKADPQETHSFEEMLAEDGVSIDDLENVSMEFGVDIE